uniref:Uncharacterized protein n=1 Tax=Anguilla anguilla TaxID=7936 RepID=A0A0E9RY50_ANGAN
MSVSTDHVQQYCEELVMSYHSRGVMISAMTQKPKTQTFSGAVDDIITL